MVYWQSEWIGRRYGKGGRDEFRGGGGGGLLARGGKFKDEEEP